MAQVRFLSAADVTRCLPMADAIEAMKSAYRQVSIGQAEMPLRGRVAGEKDGVTLTMPAYLRESGELGIKIVSVFPQNVGIPIIHALVLALDATTGQALALIEGNALTAIRTAAGSGAATDVLARADAKTAAIIGSGTQARTHLEAVCTVREIEQVFVYSPTTAHAERFITDMRGKGPIPDAIHMSTTPEEAIRDADVVCTTTTSKAPVFDGAALRAGTHINAVGSYTPEMCEVDRVTLQRAQIFVDERNAVLAEAGEIIQAIEEGAIQESDILAEIGAVIAGTAAGRPDTEAMTYFKSVGVAAQDAAAAHLVLRNAAQQQVGQLLEL